MKSKRNVIEIIKFDFNIMADRSINTLRADFQILNSSWKILLFAIDSNSPPILNVNA